jgi:hypothetical protein
MSLRNKFSIFFKSKSLVDVSSYFILSAGLIDAYLWFVTSFNNNLLISYNMTAGYFVPSWTITILCVMNFILIKIIVKWWDKVP